MTRTMPRRPDTRQRLVAAALAVANDDGYAHTTTRAVAARAGVSEATIYRHFPDKLSLLAAVIAEHQAHLEEYMARLPARAGTSTVQAVLTETLEYLAANSAELIPLEHAMLTDPKLAAARRELLKGGPPNGGPAHLIAYLRSEQELGRLAPDADPVAAAMLLLAALFSSTIGLGSPPDATVMMVLRGIEPRRSATD